MAVTRLIPSRIDTKLEAELRQGILDELRRPDDTAQPPGAPTLYMEESGTPFNYTHWYAVWECFDGTDDEERTRILLDAIREVFGPEEALRVTTALGLTSVEAEAMGLAA